MCSLERLLVLPSYLIAEMSQMSVTASSPCLFRPDGGNSFTMLSFLVFVFYSAHLFINLLSKSLQFSEYGIHFMPGT